MDPVEIKKSVRQLKKNDVSAFDSLFKSYAPKVFNFCNKIIENRYDAEELTQEVFTALWENRMKIDENLSFSAYIFGIARNQINSLFRKNIYRQNYLHYLDGKSEILSFVTDDEIQLNELKEFLNRGIEQLPPKRKEIFKLSRLKGLSYKEIATHLGISENTVDVQMRKSLDFLRELVKNHF